MQTAPEPDPAGHDVDGLKSLPGVWSAAGDEKAGTGELDPEGVDPIDSHVASDVYPVHPTIGGPPSRHP